MSAAPGVPEEQEARTDRHRPRPSARLISCSGQALSRQPFPALPDLPGRGGLWPPAVQEVWDAAERGRLGQSIVTAVQGTCTAARMDDAGWERVWSVAAARLLLAAGRLGSARAAARCALHVPGGSAGSDLARFAARDVLARVAMATGDPPGLAAATHDVAHMMASRRTEVRTEGTWLHVLLRDRARARSEDLGPLAPTPVRPSTWFGAPPELCDDAALARLLTRDGHLAAARSLLGAAADRRTRQPHRIDAAATHEAVAGVVERDARPSLRAASLFDRSGRRLAAAAAREDAAAALRAEGRDSWTDVLTDAISVYDRAGARADAARARATLQGRRAERSSAWASRP